MYKNTYIHNPLVSENIFKHIHYDNQSLPQFEKAKHHHQFHRYDLVSTGPNIFPWAEWHYYNFTQDQSRLEKVFPVLVSYHQWLMQNRTWPDGSYFASGWATGMDNQKFGVNRYPFGQDNLVDLYCDMTQKDPDGFPTITCKAHKPMKLKVHFQGQTKYIASIDYLTEKKTSHVKITL
ncbi:MGH1-like glycoside hydrolase domain-containing protein [Facilibium subflavum]|uniref:MGH1-like glycoside hydrolase domain-containing protein n=1 Tax=Facilibium subflavum TaxID=2219058 RepID=UPI001AACAC19|nr:hypothetical protein [Facilibium subflavum]